MIAALLLAFLPQSELSAQDMIDVAEPGSVVVLHADPDAPFPPREVIHIRKPLTLIGNGRAFRNIFMHGQGGRVVLQRVGLYHQHWCIVDCHDTYELAPHGLYEATLLASGFDEVHLLDVQSDGRASIQGASLVLVERCRLQGFEDGAPLEAPGATLLVFDSTIYHDQAAHPGIRGAREVFFSSPSLALQMIDVDEAHLLDDDLSMDGSGKLGTPLVFDWTAFAPPGALALLYAYPGVRAPTENRYGYWNFLGPNPLFIHLGRKGNVPIPVRRVLIGLEVSFQAHDLGGRHSRPAFVLIRP